MATPRYTHDCDACRFLGRVAVYDLYACIACDDVTLIARRSSEGSDYASRGFMLDAIGAVKRHTGNLDHDQAMVLALFRELPSLLLNIWERP